MEADIGSKETLQKCAGATCEVLYSQGPKTLHSGTPKMHVTFFTLGGGKMVVMLQGKPEIQFFPNRLAAACPAAALGLK